MRPLTAAVTGRTGAAAGTTSDNGPGRAVPSRPPTPDPATVALGGAPVEVDRLLTPLQARAILGVTNNTLARWADAGRLPSVRTPGRQRRYRAADVEQLRTALGRPVVAPPPRTSRPPILRGQRRPLLSAGQVAQIVDATPRTVRRWTIAGALPATRTTGGHYRWRPEDIDGFVAKYQLAAPPRGAGGDLDDPGAVGCRP